MNVLDKSTLKSQKKNVIELVISKVKFIEIQTMTRILSQSPNNNETRSRFRSTDPKLMSNHSQLPQCLTEKSKKWVKREEPR